jgi:hypothetical protein
MNQIEQKKLSSDSEKSNWKYKNWKVIILILHCNKITESVDFKSISNLVLIWHSTHDTNMGEK